MADFTAQLINAFITLFVIIDPFTSTPVFYSMTRKKSAEEKLEAAKTATLVAASALFVFMVAGPFLFGLLGININHFRIAGGIILFIIGLEYVLKITLPREKQESHVNLEVVVIGVPLITGPGALTVSVILVNTVGLEITALAAALVMVCTFFILLLAPRIMALLGETGSEVFSRIMGLLLASIAVNMVLTGLAAARSAVG
ncbi:MAG: MarC family protein [Candidatus Norongarragalinales archaeon]